ncbi:MAG TPA: glutamyl-tRNA reductase, partial [Azospirillaceae bacterium]|nr:glutamyl-tRNA reductase [Azospirillaceae bacterium]
LLHTPSEVLRAWAAEESGAGLTERAAAERLLRQLFRLEAETDRVAPPPAQAEVEGESER